MAKSQKELNSISNIIKIILIVSLVASLIVTSIAISLKERQNINIAFEKQVALLKVSGQLDNNKIKNLTIQEGQDLYEKHIEEYIVNFSDGNVSKKRENQEFDNQNFIELTLEQDTVKIRNLEQQKIIYFIRDNDKQFAGVILPMRGYGLWSMLYGYLSLDKDLNTVKDIIYYSHAETPGLGGEVSNPKWTRKWQGKKIYKDESVALNLTKNNKGTEFEIDALSGATLTTNGVNNILSFWMGNIVYKNILDNINKLNQ